MKIVNLLNRNALRLMSLALMGLMFMGVSFPQVAEARMPAECRALNQQANQTNRLAQTYKRLTIVYTNVNDQIAAVFSVLEELGIEEKDALLVLNKVDQCANPSQVQAVANRS